MGYFFMKLKKHTMVRESFKEKIADSFFRRMLLKRGI